MRKRVRTKRSANAHEMKQLHAAAAAFNRFRPKEAFTRVRAVPTIFIQYDHGVRVGGHPTERIALVHGPSGEGKTLFTLGLCRSFLRFYNPCQFIDAERTLEDGFIRLSFGDELYERHIDPETGLPREDGMWFPCRPDSYEDTKVEVREFCNTVAGERRAGRLPKEACGLIVVDSIRKLVPKDMWQKILKLAKRTNDQEKARDRSAQIKAMMNAAWCDELIPLLEKTGCTMVIIAREAEDPDADVRSKMFGTAYKTGGGKALYYDASLDIRIERARYVQKENKAEREGEYAKPTVYGERHRITIKKSKVSGKEDKTIIAFFHSSNGKLIANGFDTARDLIELGIREGVIKGGSKEKKAGGGWMQWEGHKWQGEHAAVKKLSSDPSLMARLENAVRAKFQQVKPIEVTGDGEVLED